MKFWILITGMVLGFVIADNTSAEQRSKVRSMARRVRAGRAATVAGTVGGFARLARVSAMRCSRRGAVTVRHHTERVRARVGEEGRDGG